MILIQLLYTLYTLRKVTVNELMAHNMVYYIEYCNFQFAVIHCLSIIHLKYYIGYIAECVLTLIYQIISITTGFVLNLFTKLRERQKKSIIKTLLRSIRVTYAKHGGC